MKPEEVGYITPLDKDYAAGLKAVVGPKSFQRFLDKWDYWLDEDTRKLTGKDWASIGLLLEDCRKEDVVPENKHDPAMALVMPEKMMKVTMVAIKFGAPWGCAYIRMKEDGVIDY